jgi:lipoprotein-anchoring transpeptidase ErfK/SrfK
MAGADMIADAGASVSRTTLPPSLHWYSRANQSASGREGFTWSGTEHISRMKEWPDWLPPKEMIKRQPYLPRFMAGGETNPLGARAMYLGNTEYRIHGTNQPSTILAASFRPVAFV